MLAANVNSIHHCFFFFCSIVPLFKVNIDKKVYIVKKIDEPFRQFYIGGKYN